MRAPRVLVVEDNPMDVHMIKLALKRNGCVSDPVVVDDGEPALAFLRNETPYENESRPDLVILDLNLKRVDGPEVLSFIRQTASLRNLTVMVLSSSPHDVLASKAPTADSYFEKPASVAEYFAIGKTIWTCFLEHFEGSSHQDVGGEHI